MNRRVGLFCAAVMSASVALLVASGSLAAPAGLSITLTSLDDAGPGCAAALDIGNDFDGPLDRFSIDVIALGTSQQAIDRVVVDLAPLPNSQVTAIALPLAVHCAAIGRLMIYNVPSCRIAGEAALRDCHAGLRTASRIGVPLDK